MTRAPHPPGRQLGWKVLAAALFATAAGCSTSGVAPQQMHPRYFPRRAKGAWRREMGVSPPTAPDSPATRPRTPLSQKRDPTRASTPAV